MSYLLKGGGVEGFRPQGGVLDFPSPSSLVDVFVSQTGLHFWPHAVSLNGGDAYASCLIDRTSTVHVTTAVNLLLIVIDVFDKQRCCCKLIVSSFYCRLMS